MSLKEAYLLTHAETEWNKAGIYQGRLDSPLTEKGRSQLAWQQRFFANKDVKALFTSPIKRCLITAQAISRNNHIPEYRITPALTATNFGSFQGRKRAELIKRYPSFYKNRQGLRFWTDPYPGGESYQDIYERICPTMQEIINNYTSAIIVSHSTVQKIIRMILLNLDRVEITEKSYVESGIILKVNVVTKKQEVFRYDNN